MLSRLLSRLTYANVMSTAAVFLALGGGALAAGLVGSDGAIKACVAKKNGAARIVGPGKACHARTERTVRWKQRPTPADFRAEAVHPVKDYEVSQVDACQDHPGYFCAVSGDATAHWRNYGEGFANVGYWRDRTGIVHLQGLATSVQGFLGPGTVVFYLPPGYRPGGTRNFTIHQRDQLSSVDVKPDGSVNVGLTGGGVVPLDGIDFRP